MTFDIILNLAFCLKHTKNLGISIDPITGSPGVSASFDSGYNDALQAVHLNDGSQVTRSLEKLVGNDIVIKNDDYKIQDVMFKKWIQIFLLR